MNPNNPLRRYHIIKKISVGGMASVFLADDKVLNREVALKMMHPHLLSHPDAVKRFSIEAKAIASLSHENIIRIFDYGDSRNRPFLVMEYIDGMNLQELLNTYGALTNLVTIGIARQIASGLVCAHKNGIIHRDIKPANILLNKNGVIRITDFGIAYLADAESITLSGTFIGSPYFISPEQANNKPLSGASDIFSMGVLLYFCLTGEPPFKGDTPHAIISAIVSDKPEPIRKKNSSVLLWLSALTEKCLNKNPAERPSATELVRIIDEQCMNASIKIESSKIIDFQNASEEYRAKEIKELFNHYQNSAVNDLRSGKLTSAIRKKEQARLLENTQYIRQKSKLLLLNPLFVSGLITIISSAALIFLIFNKFKGHESPEPEFNSLLTFQTNNPKINAELIPVEKDSISNILIPNEIHKQTSNVRDNLKIQEKPIDTFLQETILNLNVGDSTPVSGYISVYTNPPWVTIYIDGIERGVTPRNNQFKLSPGVHSLRLIKTGFPEYIDTFTIGSSDTLTKRIRLEPQNTRTSIRSE